MHNVEEDQMINWAEVNTWLAGEESVADVSNGYYSRRSPLHPGAFTMRETAVAVPLDALGGAVLDLGCGCGTWLLYLRDRGVPCYGVDRSEEAVAVANKLLINHGHTARARVGDLREATGEWGLVTAFAVLYDAYPTQDGMLDYLRELLLPGGWLALEYYVDQEPRIEGRGYLSVEAMVLHAKAHGLEVVSVTTRQTKEHENALYVFRRA